MSQSKFLAVAVLLFVLALWSTQNVWAVTELFYDNGVETMGAWACPHQDGWLAVKFVFSDFSLSGSWKLLTARFYQSTQEGGSGQGLELHVLNSDGSGDLSGSTPVTFTTIAGWNDVDLSGQNIVVSGDFWIAYKWLGQFQSPCLGFDNSAPDGRSFSGSLGSWTVDGTSDYMIRAVIGSLGGGAAVGGFVEPVNRLVVFAPYVALLGVIAAVAVIAWKGPEN
jgi:hypothetical protein